MRKTITVVTRRDIENNVHGPSDQVMDALRRGPWEHDVSTESWYRRPREFLVARDAMMSLARADRRWAQTRLTEAVARMTDLPPTQDGPAQALAPDGFTYDAVCSFGGRHDRVQCEPCCTDFHMAIAFYLDALRDYGAAHPGDILWWRTRPEIDFDVRHGTLHPIWRVYSRLRIGMAPMETAEAA